MVSLRLPDLSNPETCQDLRDRSLAGLAAEGSGSGVALLRMVLWIRLRLLLYEKINIAHYYS